MRYFFFLLLLLITSISRAQDNNLDARAAYQIAEEEFNAGKYASSISYLDEATAKLGGARAKILYLKIMALQVLAEDDDASLEALKKTITDFEKVPDYHSFNEEKQLEVMKLKLRLNKEGSLGRSVDPIEASAYTKLGLKGWRVGVKFEAMKEEHPDYFSRAKKTAVSDTLAYYQLETEQNLAVTVMKGVVISVTKSLLPINAKDDASFSTGRNMFADIKNYLGGNPSETVANYDSPPSKWVSMTNSSTGLSWKSNKIMVFATLVTMSTKKYKEAVEYNSTLTLGVYYLPK